MEYLMVKNFENYQHYKDRNPAWIKLYNSLLDDYEFCHLPDVSKWHMVGIFLLASRYQNRIPYDEKWLAQKLSSDNGVDVDSLVSCGMLCVYQDASNTLAKAVPREEESREEESRKSCLPDGSGKGTTDA